MEEMIERLEKPTIKFHGLYAVTWYIKFTLIQLYLHQSRSFAQEIGHHRTIKINSVFQSINIYLRFKTYWRFVIFSIHKHQRTWMGIAEDDVTNG